MKSYIQLVDRKTFEQALDLAISETRRLKRERQGASYWHVFPSAELQLHAIRHWTRDGRDPTLEQRASIDVGVRLVRVFDQVDPDDIELANYKELVDDVATYACFLPSEEELTQRDKPGWPPLHRWLLVLQDVAKQLRAMPNEERRRLLELDDIPYPEDAGFPGQSKP